MDSLSNTVVEKKVIGLEEHVTLLSQNSIFGHCLSILRDKKCSGRDKRNAVRFLFPHIAMMALAKLKTQPKEIDTGVAMTTVYEVIQEIVVVEILRAGNTPAHAIVTALDLVSGLKVHVSTMWEKRNEESLIPTMLCKDIPIVKGGMYLIIDPMKSTGGSMDEALTAIFELLKANGVAWQSCDFATVTLMETPRAVLRTYKHVTEPKQFSAVLDGGPNQVGFIVPGGGDLGDELVKP
ncbi:MAG: uracil phosphoribosyltransferase [bacterium]|nr:uracil phosphoribosyltransferase [bacterium]